MMNGDGGVSDDAGVDQGARRDAGGVDMYLADVGSDASPDVGVDAGPCASGCIATDPCAPSECNPATGMCEASTLPDGTLCGETDTLLCVAGQCVMRGCGDGYREPGGMALWPREGCDDQNADDGDTCSMGCEPTEFTARVDPGSEEYSARFSATGRLLVLDGLGNGLLVWVQHHIKFGEARQELRASRLDRYGNFLDLENPLTVDKTTLTSFDMTPTAVGLTSGGFVVAWTASRMVGGLPAFVVRMRRVAVDGSLSSEQVVHGPMEGSQRYPQLAALTDSFVVVWEDSTSDSDVWGRRFRNTSGAVSEVFPVASTTTDTQTRPSVAAHGDEFMVAWLSQIGDFSAPIQLRARRFLQSGPLGNEFVVLPGDATSLELTDVDPEGDSYLLAYTTRGQDGNGDLYAMSLPHAAGGVLGAAVPLDVDANLGASDPHVAPYGPGGSGGYVVVYNDNDPVPHPLFLSVGITPPEEVDALRLLMRGERFPVVAAAPYELTGGSVWFGYTAQVVGARVGAVVFQLPPP
ncbi:MAG: hypothetical protein R3B40_18985 [Polyangiales bacterium]|nr:hypothetical protein [Myxococcales bacterium]